MNFDRILKMLSIEDINKIKNTKVLIVGIGGVGGYALESLVRMGVNNITIVDHDKVDETNLNRQIIALNSTICQKKVIVAKDRMLDINPNINIIVKDLFLNNDTIDTLGADYDYIIDACDTITTKVLLIRYALNNDIKIISCMGTGNRLDPTKLEITSLDKTKNDPLAKVIRKLIKEANIKAKIPVVCSKELPKKINSRIPGSCALVPSVAGIYLASFVINDILENMK